VYILLQGSQLRTTEDLRIIHNIQGSTLGTKYDWRVPTTSGFTIRDQRRLTYTYYFRVHN